MDYKGYHQYIDDVLPPESPYLYGLHPNAEIGFLTATSENLFKTILELQPRDSGGIGSGGQTREEKVSNRYKGQGSIFTISTDIFLLLLVFCPNDTLDKRS